MRSRADGGRTALALVLVALASLAPFASGLLRGHSFYFRDLAAIFIPVRSFAAQALAHGRLLYWNPLDHEGVPLPHPPLSYPFDALQALAPGPFAVTLLLALHVPLAALALFTLARALGASRLAAAGGGLVYALGGFGLSTVSLYVYVQGLAWTPLVVLAMLRLGRGGRHFVWTALAVAVLASTLALEFLIQALVVGAVLGLGASSDPRGGRWRRLLPPAARLAVATVLGLALAAPTLLVMRATAAQGARGAGLPASVTLAHSVHPFTLLQVLVADLYGDMTRPADSWWGVNFFPRGFPYFVSLYLGATVIALAWTGLRRGVGPRLRLALLAGLALVVCLGRYAGLEPLVGALPLLSAVRYPSKAFLTLQLALALLAALGWDALEHEPRRAGRSLAHAGLLLGSALVLLPIALPAVLPRQAAWFLAAFFPDGMAPPARQAALALISRDAMTGGALALLAGGLALAVALGRLRPDLTRLALVGLVAADLIRCGAGLNPMTRTSFYELSDEMRPLAAEIRSGGGRALVCANATTRGYWQARASRPAGHELWTFAVMLETFEPHLNMLHGVPTALGEDHTSLVPVRARPADPEGGCSRFEAMLPRLRQAAVSHVVSLDPIDSPSLWLERVVTPARIAPAAIHVYRLLDPLPRASVAPTEDAAATSGRILQLRDESDAVTLDVEAARPSVALLRDTWTPGWTAAVDGRPVPVLRADGLHRAVPVPAGTSRVVFRYRPPGLGAGTRLALAALLLLVALEAATRWWARRAGARAQSAPS